MAENIMDWVSEKSWRYTFELLKILKYKERSKNTVNDWINLYRNITKYLFNKRQPLEILVGLYKMTNVSYVILMYYYSRPHSLLVNSIFFWWTSY